MYRRAATSYWGMYFRHHLCSVRHLTIEKIQTKEKAKEEQKRIKQKHNKINKNNCSTSENFPLFKEGKKYICISICVNMERKATAQKRLNHGIVH